MTRFTTKLLGAMVVVGCGSNAMAARGHGYYGDGDPSQTTPYQDPDQDQTQTLGPPGQPYQQVPPSQNVGPPAPGDDQNQNATPSQPQGTDPGDDQDQDEDSAESPSASQGRLGVIVMQLTPELRRHFGAPAHRGVLIAKVEPGSAAERAGLAVGDVLVRVGRQPVASGNDVVQALAARSSERVPLSVIRAANLIRLAATIPGAQPQPPDRPIHHL